MNLSRSGYKVVKAGAAVVLQFLILGAIDARAEPFSLRILSSEEVLEGLKEFAFVPFGSKTERFLVKWKDGIRFGASKEGDVAPEIVAFVSEELAAISRLTRLKIESKNDDANLIVVFTDDPERDFPKYNSELKQLLFDDANIAKLYKDLTEGEFPCAGKTRVTDKYEIAYYFFRFHEKTRPGQDQSLCFSRANASCWAAAF